jgi:hypothetical protein
MLTDLRSDVMKLTVVFREYAKAPKNRKEKLKKR